MSDFVMWTNSCYGRCTVLLCPRVSALGGSDILLFFPWKCAYNLDGSLENRVILLASLM